VLGRRNHRPVADPAPRNEREAHSAAKRAAEADSSDPIPAIWLGAAQCRASQTKGAITTLTKGLSQLDRALAAPPNKSDQILVARLMGEMILALAYHDQGDRGAVAKRLETLRRSIENAEASEKQTDETLSPWAVNFAAEIAKRQLAKLGGSTVTAPK
jgi:hypothetical protein